jgi:hypothetical protein
MGIDWWRHDAGLTSTKRELEDENEELRARIAELESSSGSQRSGARKRS